MTTWTTTAQWDYYDVCERTSEQATQKMNVRGGKTVHESPWWCSTRWSAHTKWLNCEPYTRTTVNDDMNEDVPADWISCRCVVPVVAQTNKLCELRDVSNCTKNKNKMVGVMARVEWMSGSRHFVRMNGSTNQPCKRNEQPRDIDNWCTEAKTTNVNGWPAWPSRTDVIPRWAHKTKITITCAWNIAGCWKRQCSTPMCWSPTNCLCLHNTQCAHWWKMTEMKQNKGEGDRLCCEQKQCTYTYRCRRASCSERVCTARARYNNDAQTKPKTWQHALSLCTAHVGPSTPSTTSNLKFGMICIAVAYV